MDLLCKRYQVKFAMIYRPWFEAIPQNWYKIGELYLGKERVTSLYNIVSFYALDMDIYLEVLDLLPAFQKILPEGVIFKVADSPHPKVSLDDHFFKNLSLKTGGFP